MAEINCDLQKVIPLGSGAAKECLGLLAPPREVLADDGHDSLDPDFSIQ